MAVNNLDFGKVVGRWASASQDRMERIFKQSTQTLANTMNAAGNVPIDTGFLRSSIRGSLTDMPRIDPAKTNKRKAPSTWDGSDLTLVIAQAKLGDTIYIGYTAAYAGFLEYGTSKMAPRGFVARATGQWQRIVRATVAQATARAG
jgi:Bacteriophage protein of unknown function (DUF646).